MTFVATPVQVRLIDEITNGRSRIIGFGGGIRGTKTYGSLAALITLCRVFPGSRWAIIRRDLQRLRDTTIPSFTKLVNDHLPGGFISAVNQSRWEADCANGSRILFRGENIDRDPELLRFHGYEVNGFLNEEADELSERTISKEIERAGTWIVPNGGEQPPAFILNTFNPTHRWPKKMFYVPWRDGTIAEPYAFIPTTAADNPFVSDEQREAWKQMPSHEYKRFVEGDWESIAGNYYDGLNERIHLIDRAVLPDPLPSWWRYWGSYDWGYGHWAVMGAWATDDQGFDYLLDSCWVRRAQDDEQALAFKESLPIQCLSRVYAGHDCWSKVTARGAQGVTTAEIMAERGILLVQADIDKVNGGRAVQRQLRITVEPDGMKQCGVYIVRTPGNLRVFDQLGEIMPDEDDIRKPGKVDAHPETGVGGDDGADMFRYGIASRTMLPANPGNSALAPDRSKGYDYSKQKPHEHETVETGMDKLFQQARRNLGHGRYQVPRR